jgi:hypothetical protein
MKRNRAIRLLLALVVALLIPTLARPQEKSAGQQATDNNNGQAGDGQQNNGAPKSLPPGVYSLRKVGAPLSPNESGRSAPLQQPGIEQPQPARTLQGSMGQPQQPYQSRPYFQGGSSVGPAPRSSLLNQNSASGSQVPEIGGSRSVAPGLQPAVSGGTQPRPIERLLRHRLGDEDFQKLQMQQLRHFGQQLERMSGNSEGQGAPNSDIYFDQARPRSGVDPTIDPNRNFGTDFFQGTNGSYRPPTVEGAAKTRDTYRGGIPGGIVLEGIATGLDQVNDIQYDPLYNGFVLDDGAFYLPRIPPATLAVLCRAIASDPSVGVSLGLVDQVYGGVPEESPLAWDMKIADHFLGDIVFARNEWTTGYRLANEFSPKSPPSGQNYHVAVFFTFDGFDFRVEKGEAIPKANFVAQVLPLSGSSAPDGRHQPDFEAIKEGRTVPEFETNARHVAENIRYYRRERIIDRMFVYGAAAAFVRHLKEAGFDLKDLAEYIAPSR